MSFAVHSSFREQQEGTFFICQKDPACSGLGKFALKARGLIRSNETCMWPKDALQPTEMFCCYSVLNPSRNLEFSLGCKAQLIIFVQRCVKASELFLFPQLSCDVTLGWLLPPAVSFTSHFSCLFYLTTQSNFGVHIMENGEHLSKGKSLVHPHLCLCRAWQITSAGR